MDKRGWGPGLLLCALLACGGNTQRADASGVSGRGGAASGGRGAGGGGSAGGTTGGGGEPTDAADASGASPTAADLQGGWYALGTVADAGSNTVTHKRIRFEGDRYFVVYNTRLAYCAEVGTFQVTAAGVEFTFERMLGVGQVGIPCLQGTSHSERVSATASGFALDFQGTVTSYARIRDVPKSFATVETHDGDFNTDATLTGLYPIDRADDFCNQSAAKPDGGRYRAMLWDDAIRSGPPGASWILPPRTTYFQADGVRNTFTTDADGYGHALHPTISDSDSLYFWAGGGCSGWTTNLNLGGSATMANAAKADWISDVRGSCNVRAGIFCVGEAGPSAGGADGGVDAGSTTPDLQGAWRRTDSQKDTERLRFDDDTYYLVWEDVYSYCAEVGRFAGAGAGGVRFTPVREEGFGPGWCPIRDDHVEVLTVTAAGITLSRDGVDAHYVRAAAVPKIFLTPELHHGDFLHDANLAGANAIAKADSFCNGSIAKPDGQRYKAILADGTNRSAVPAVDWVTKPNTTYYQAAGARALFTANAQGLYDRTIIPAPPFLSGFGNFAYLWSGLDIYFATAYRTCQGWTSSADTEQGDCAEAAGRELFTAFLPETCAHRSRGLICASQ